MNAKADKSESQGAKTVPSSNSAWRRTLVFDSHVAYTELNTPSPYTLLSVYAFVHVIIILITTNAGAVLAI